MEYMRLEGFLGGAVSKLINKGIENKVGYRPNIQFDNFSLSTTNSVEINMKTNESETKEETIVVDMRLTMKQKDFNKLMEEITK